MEKQKMQILEEQISLHQWKTQIMLLVIPLQGHHPNLKYHQNQLAKRLKNHLNYR
jgi:hypothetical protein